MPEPTAPPALEIDNLTTCFDTQDGVAVAVDGMSYSVRSRETVGIVGESGCGKSVTALSALRLIPTPPGRIAGGRVLLEGRDLLQLGEADMRQVRGNAISMIFQDPMTSLNPVLTIGQQIAEIGMLHQGLSRKSALDRAAEMLRVVHIPDQRRRLEEYPHQLSGGMRQRVMIAIALTCSPKVLIADEPTTALDVTIQAQILDLLVELQESTGTAIVMITHDLGVVSEMAQRVVVMYAGQKIEEAPVGALFEAPLHPYTCGLLAASPRFAEERNEAGHRRPLAEISGTVPPLTNPLPGCRFAPRCPLAEEHCRRAPPPLVERRPGHWAACWHAGEMPPVPHA
ncbi:MAG TPA: ABC transporter ATP-binding protein [Stellaceae bacterium]|nr:ABC transporter ATP-binding protein [Stellaceae bacterium]